MKKYRISRFYREFYLSALFFMLALKIMFILMTIFYVMKRREYIP